MMRFVKVLAVLGMLSFLIPACGGGGGGGGGSGSSGLTDPSECGAGTGQYGGVWSAEGTGEWEEYDEDGWIEDRVSNIPFDNTFCITHVGDDLTINYIGEPDFLGGPSTTMLDDLVGSDYALWSWNIREDNGGTYETFSMTFRDLTTADCHHYWHWISDDGLSEETYSTIIDCTATKSDDGTGGNGGTGGCAAPSANYAGDWRYTITRTVTSGSSLTECENVLGGDWGPYDGIISVTGNEMVLHAYSGQVCANLFTGSGTRETIMFLRTENVELTFSSDSSFSGTGSTQYLRYSSPLLTCEAAVTLTGQRL